MARRNCHRVKSPLADGDPLAHLATEGWVGIEGGELWFRPQRGSSGLALYDSKEKAMDFTGCPDAIRVQLKIERVP